MWNKNPTRNNRSPIKRKMVLKDTSNGDRKRSLADRIERLEHDNKVLHDRVEAKNADEDFRCELFPCPNGSYCRIYSNGSYCSIL